MGWTKSLLREQEERKRRKGTKTGAVIARCQVGDHPIYAEGVPSGKKAFEMLAGRPICFLHFKALKR